MHGRLALLLLAGCSGTLERDTLRLQREVEELRRRTDGDRHAVHELENRVFIVEDKLDTANVARDKTEAMPRLPVVTKRAAEPEPEPELETFSVPASEPITAEKPRYETDGDEEEGDGRPPIVIRLDGRAGRPASRPAPPLPADLASVNEKLPVVPMPKRGAAPAAPAGPSASSPGDAMAAYQSAYQALGRREHAVAIRELRGFLDRWPAHDYSDNAQYWLGEAYYDQSDFQTALAEFRAVLRKYPDGNKAPDALLKVGFCMSKLGDSDGARDVLAQVVDIYPRTDAARLATQRLAELSGRHPR